MDRILFTPLSGYEPPHVHITVHGEVPNSVPTIAITNAPSLLIARRAKYAPELNAGSAETSDITLFARGDPDSCLLIILGEREEELPHRIGLEDTGSAIIAEAESVSPQLGKIAALVTAGLNEIDDECAFIRKASGKWMNKRVNFFTLKIQPTKNNIHFTIYGNPGSFDHDNFLKSDQNSYSRGWIGTTADAKSFLKFAEQSYDRRSSR